MRLRLQRQQSFSPSLGLRQLKVFSKETLKSPPPPQTHRFPLPFAWRRLARSHVHEISSGHMACLTTSAYCWDMSARRPFLHEGILVSCYSSVGASWVACSSDWTGIGMLHSQVADLQVGYQRAHQGEK